MNRAISLAIIVLFAVTTSSRLRAAEQPGRWSAQQANDWYAKQPWFVGANFGPSTAINQLEMWQADTFDLKTIDRELGWAADLGFNSMRVFLHHLLWEQDSKGLLKRMEQFLDVCEKHNIGVMFVLFDSVWDPNPKPGKQREPKPHLHNSGWVQSPGKADLTDPSRHKLLEAYVKGVVRHFKDDKRVQVWDVWNEPDNINRPAYVKEEPPKKVELSLALMEKAFTWARDAKPSQPLTSGVWIGNWPDPKKLSPTEQFQLDNSDVITFHSYDPLEGVKKCVENLKRYNRPIWCTEYMARPRGSKFDPLLAYFKEQKVGAHNWGFVAGKTQTIYPWDSWDKQYTAEPPLWFHDIFRADGTPYIKEEVEYIKGVTGKKS